MKSVSPVIIVGAGIVGLSAAFALQQRGVACIVIDAKGAGRETSFGNAGSVSVASIFPQALPGISRKALAMLMNPLAPLKINGWRLGTVLPWLIRFVAQARWSRVGPIVDALAALNRDAAAHWLQLARSIDAEDLVQAGGLLHVYSEQKNFAEDAWQREWINKRGFRIETLDRAGLLKLEPHLSEAFQHGMLEVDALSVRDPGALCARLADYLQAQGVTFVQATVSAIEKREQGYSVYTEQGVWSAAKVLLATGVWTNRLLASASVMQKIPLIPARGYHLMFEHSTEIVRRPVLWCERYMVLSPMARGLRMTSIKELTTLDSEPRFRFIRRLAAEARKVFPSLSVSLSAEWMGNRPCTPDSLPILDKVADHEIYVATGHGHLGLTQGPVSGHLIAQRICDEKTDIDLTPFTLTRFG